MDIDILINRMVNQLKEQGAISSVEVEMAFRQVQRHRFLETFYLPGEGLEQPIKHDPHNPCPEHLDIIYSNRSLITRISGEKASSSTSEPSLIAVMLEQLMLSPGIKVLEIGAGTGYNAALMSELVGNQTPVVSVDIQGDVITQTQRLLAEAGYPNIKLVLQDGLDGVQKEGPYDRIVATVGSKDLSANWVNQLSPSGFILLPLTHAGWTPLVKIWLQEGCLRGKVVGFSGFMLLEEQEPINDPWQLSSKNSFVFENAQEFPLFEGLEAEHTHGYLMWSAFPLNFYYFMAMRDSRAFWSPKPRGYGLHDQHCGTILISPQKGCVFLKGDRELYRQLREIYEDWSQLGKPKLFDYTMEFVPRSKGVPSPKLGWVIERKFYYQFLSLSKF